MARVKGFDARHPRNPCNPRLPLLSSLNPALFVDLAAAGDGESFGRNVFGDGGPRRDISIFSDSDGSDQLRVGADESAVFNDGLVLLHAVVVARDNACADVDMLTDRRVTQIGEVPRFRSSAECG